MNIIERAEGASGTAHSSGSPAALDSSGSPAAPNTFRVDPALLALGVQLLDVPLAHESILAARGVLLEHSAPRHASCPRCCARRWASTSRWRR